MPVVESLREGGTAVKLNAPTRWVFYASVLFGGLAVLIYFLGVLGLIGGGFLPLSYHAFWLAVVAWLMLVAGVTLKGL